MSRDHGVRDRVGVALVGVTGPADTPCELYTAPLLHGVRCLVRRGVQVGVTAKCDGVPGGIGGCPQVVSGDRGGATDVSLDLPDVVPAEQALDGAGMGKRLARSRYAACSDLLHLRWIGGFSARLPLHGRLQKTALRHGHRQRLLARS